MISLGSDSWLIGPRLLRGLAAAVGLIALALPAVFVKWATATSPLPEQPDIGEIRPEMVVVPKDTYSVGASDSDRFIWAQHDVQLSAFAISKTEITQEQYEHVMGKNPLTDTTCGSKCPVTDVSWQDAVKYLNALSERAKVEACYRFEGDQVEWVEGCTGYRLPTEAEWEVAARATTTDRYAGTDDPDEVCLYANVGDATYKKAENPVWDTFECDDEYKGLAPVGSFLANDFHLVDMTGNVWEWVWDWQGEEIVDNTDPRGPESGQYRVIRGGSFSVGPRGARVSIRYLDEPSERIPSLGFRVARSLP